MANLICKDGTWTPEQEGLISIPDCQRKWLTDYIIN